MDNKTGAAGSALRQKVSVLVVKSAAVLMAVLIAVSISSCGSDIKTDSSRCTVGAVLKSGTSEYWMSVSSGMKDAADKYNIDIVIMYPDDELQDKQQNYLAEELVARNVDVLAVSPIDSRGEPDYVKAATDKDIPVITFDTTFRNSGLPYIGSDNEKIGYELAKQLAEAQNHTGEVGVISGDLNQTCHSERVAGFRRYINSEPDMKIVFIESGYANMQMSEDKVQELLEKYPSVRGIMASSAVTAMGLVAGTKDRGINIAAVDVQTDAINALKNGGIEALAAQSGYDIGYETILWISRMLDGESEADKVIINTEILTEDNIEDYINENENLDN